jgi:quercetin dioxygenase-like cupin family protein
MTVQVRSWESVGGGAWRIVAGAAETDGLVVVGEAGIEAGGQAPGRHVHRDHDEHIYVIDGTLTVEIDGERTEVHGGQFVTLPKGIPHVFGNLSDGPVRCLGITGPEMEAFFREQEAYFASLDGPPDTARLQEIAERHGIVSLGPPLTA